MLSLTGVERSYAAAIGETMQNLSIRSEVGSVMETMLGDLEAWGWANKEEALKRELQHARAQVAVLKESERALLEREAMAAAKAEEDKAVARDVRGKFVQELWGLAREFRLREQEQAKADQLSKKLARLEGVEADLHRAQRKLAQFQQAGATAVSTRMNKHDTESPRAGESGGGAEFESGCDPSLGSPNYVGSTAERGGGVSVEGIRRGPELSPERVEGVVGQAGGGGSGRCRFLEMEKRPLLKVFVFLSAPEVLTAAQVCRSMFRKVDQLFGIGNQGAATSAQRAPGEPGLNERRSFGGGGGGVSSTRSRAGSTTSTSSLPSSVSGPSGLGQRTLANAFGVVASRVEAVTAGASGGFGALAGAAASFTGGGVGSGGAGNGNGGGGASGAGGDGAGHMSLEFVEGLSKRLTTAEMRGIIQLTERGRRLEAKAGALQAEKEDLNARLQGTESVKEFLVSKLKETEAALKRSLDEKGLTLRQSESDQEVISFLDSRTQEMERVAQETMDKAVTYQNELENARLSGQKQIKVLEDMLRFEKQRGEAEESAFKAQKKLLVTEVKKLRTVNVGLEAECGDLRQQLKDLRQSVSQLRR